MEPAAALDKILALKALTKCLHGLLPLRTTEFTGETCGDKKSYKVTLKIKLKAIEKYTPENFVNSTQSLHPP